MKFLNVYTHFFVGSLSRSSLNHLSIKVFLCFCCLHTSSFFWLNYLFSVTINLGFVVFVCWSCCCCSCFDVFHRICPKKRFFCITLAAVAVAVVVAVVVVIVIIIIDRYCCLWYCGIVVAISMTDGCVCVCFWRRNLHMTLLGRFSISHSSLTLISHSLGLSDVVFCIYALEFDLWIHSWSIIHSNGAHKHG